MRRLFYIIFLVFIFVGQSYASLSQLELIRIMKKISNEPQFELIIYQPIDDCSFYDLKTLKEVYMRLRECGYGIKHIDTGHTLKLYIYRSNTMSKPLIIKYTKIANNLLEYINYYFPEWTIDTPYDLSKIEFNKKWKPIDIFWLADYLKSDYDVFIDKLNKKLTIIPKSKKYEQKLYYGLFYPLRDRNRDFYELVKGYFSQTNLIKYTRDGKIYIMFSKPTLSREDCVKIFIYLKSLLDDKWQKAQKLGNYFPKDERQNLKLLYQLLSDTEIKPFRQSEIIPLSESILISKGLNYKFKFKKKFDQEISNLFKNNSENKTAEFKKNKKTIKKKKLDSVKATELILNKSDLNPKK